MVEFAVVLPVLLAIILGILFFGRYESYSGQMTHLSEVGVRDAAVNFSVPTGSTANGSTCATGTNANLACYLASQATGELASGNGSSVQAVSVWVDCNYKASGTSCTPGNNVAVCLQAQVSFPGLSNVGSYTISQQAVMRVEQTGAQDSAFVESSGNVPTATNPPSALPANSPC